MDIYALKADATGGMFDARYLAKQYPTGSKERRFYLAQERRMRKLMEMCEGWAGYESPSRYISDCLFEMSVRDENAVRRAATELGYRLPKC